MKRIIVLVLIAMFVVSCGGPSGDGVSDNVSSPDNTVFLGRIGGDYMYRFTDGDTVCYYVDGYESTALDCTLD